MRASALFVEGVEHVARLLQGAIGEQKHGICKRIESGLEVAQRPHEYAQGVRAAIKAAREDAGSD